MSWIHADDILGLFLLALDNPEARGPINGTAPNPARNVDFSQGPGEGPAPAVPPDRPARPRARGDARRGGQGRHEGQRVLPARAEQLGYRFPHPDLAEALTAAFDEGRSGDARAGAGRAPDAHLNLASRRRPEISLREPSRSTTAATRRASAAGSAWGTPRCSTSRRASTRSGRRRSRSRRPGRRSTGPTAYPEPGSPRLVERLAEHHGVPVEPRDRRGRDDRADRPDRPVAPRGPRLPRPGARRPVAAPLPPRRPDLRRIPPGLQAQRAEGQGLGRARPRLGAGRPPPRGQRDLLDRPPRQPDRPGLGPRDP